MRMKFALQSNLILSNTVAFLFTFDNIIMNLIVFCSYPGFHLRPPPKLIQTSVPAREFGNGKFPGFPGNFRVGNPGKKVSGSREYLGVIFIEIKPNSHHNSS